MTKDEALKLALEALKSFQEISDFTPARAVHAITAIKEALAQPEQEPVGFAVMERPWVGLTNSEVNNFAAGCHLGKSVQAAIYEAEATLKEKNA